jgi:hypothetical protein
MAVLPVGAELGDFLHEGSDLLPDLTEREKEREREREPYERAPAEETTTTPLLFACAPVW